MPKYPKPTGRPRLDHTWDASSGKWIFSTTLAAARNRQQDEDRLKPRVIPPKRARSGYILFTTAKRKLLKYGHCKDSLEFQLLNRAGEQTKFLCKMWRNATEKERSHFNAQSDIEKAASAAARQDFKPFKTRSSLQVLIDQLPNPPKRPPAPFLVYAASVREDVKTELLELGGLGFNNSVSSSAIIKEVSKRWKQLSAEEKAEWTQKRKELNAEYLKQIEPAIEMHKALSKQEKIDLQTKAAKDAWPQGPGDQC